MNECSLNLGQLLKLLLQRLADVMRLAQQHVPGSTMSTSTK
jgi:hypothetical protein